MKYMDWKYGALVTGAFVGFLATTDAPASIMAHYATLSASITSAILPQWTTGSSFFVTAATMVGSLTMVFMTLLGLVLGAWLSSSMAGQKLTATQKLMSEEWKSAKGSDTKQRLVWCLFGGMVMMIGAGLAGGAFFDHTFTSMSWLAVSSSVFFISMLLTGRWMTKTFYAEAK